MARPRKELDAEQVYKLAKLGCTQAEIADVFGVGQATISRNYGSDYARAQGEFKTSLRRAQYLRAVRDKSDKMLIHLGQQVLGQIGKNDAGLPEPEVTRYVRVDNGRDAGLQPPESTAPVAPEPG